MTSVFIEAPGWLAKLADKGIAKTAGGLVTALVRRGQVTGPGLDECTGMLKPQIAVEVERRGAVMLLEVAPNRRDVHARDPGQILLAEFRAGVRAHV
jgi:hypothetical protein